MKGAAHRLDIRRTDQQFEGQGKRPRNRALHSTLERVDKGVLMKIATSAMHTFNALAYVEKASALSWTANYVVSTD